MLTPWLACRQAFLLLVVIIGGLPSAAVANPSLVTGGPASFKVGERLTYALSWGKIQAGTAVLEISGRQSVSGRSVLKLIHTARSNDFVSVFYPVNNRVESLFDEEALMPTHLSFKRREGKRKNDIEVIFDQTAHRASVTKDGQTENVEIPAHVQDTLSCLYFFRTLPFPAVGSTASIDVHHDKKNYHLEVRMEGFERLTTPLGDIETIRFLAIMPFRGLFLNEGNIRVWFTNEPARIPVLMRAKVVVGSISATLSNVEGTRPAAWP